MTSETFLKSISSLSGLKPDMIATLHAMAPSMTEEQRENAIATLTPLNAQILAKQVEIEQAVALQEQALKTFKKTRMPEIKAIVTEREQRDADAMIDNAISA